ncbi:hypothetical protein K3495_g8978 [Podosphaera aphanis]|nr:hypothetical protein K3495_g8978 [Podosphaera aphanis]
MQKMTLAISVVEQSPILSSLNGASRGYDGSRSATVVESTAVRVRPTKPRSPIDRFPHGLHILGPTGPIFLDRTHARLWCGKNQHTRRQKKSNRPEWALETTVTHRLTHLVSAASHPVHQPRLRASADPPMPGPCGRRVEWHEGGSAAAIYGVPDVAHLTQARAGDGRVARVPDARKRSSADDIATTPGVVCMQIMKH